MYNYKNVHPEECEFLQVSPKADLPEGERLFLDIDGLAIVILNIAGELYAIGDICSHDDGPLGDGEVKGYEIFCPRHGASFDIRNGKALSLPAIVDIPAYPIRVVDGMIELGVPKDSD